MSTRHTYTCCNTITQSHNQAPPPPHCHTPQTHTVQTACTHAQCAHEAREGWRPHTHPRPVSPSSWCLCLGRCVSLWVSVSLPEPQPLHGCPWGCGQHAERCHWGGLARERPRGGGSRSATHPAYQTALGEGRGREVQQPQMDPEPRLLPHPAPPLGDPERWRQCRGGGRQRAGETPTEGERQRQRDRVMGRGRQRRGKQHRAGNRWEQTWERPREKMGGQRESHKDREGARSKERDRETGTGREIELGKPRKGE